MSTLKENKQMPVHPHRATTCKFTFNRLPAQLRQIVPYEKYKANFALSIGMRGLPSHRQLSMCTVVTMHRAALGLCMAYAEFIQP